MNNSPHAARFYDGSRMDTIWAFRQGSVAGSTHVEINLIISVRYDTARKIKKSQDEYCTKALLEEWNDLGPFPEDLQWEALVDVLRGRVKAGFELYYISECQRNLINTGSYSLL
jgi:hypothetical protein